MAKVCQALAHAKLSERIGEARACRAPSCADISETVAMALPCQSYADVSETVTRLFRAKAPWYRANRPGGRG